MLRFAFVELCLLCWICWVVGCGGRRWGRGEIHLFLTFSKTANPNNVPCCLLSSLSLTLRTWTWIWLDRNLLSLLKWHVLVLRIRRGMRVEIENRRTSFLSSSACVCTLNSTQRHTHKQGVWILKSVLNVKYSCACRVETRAASVFYFPLEFFEVLRRERKY